MNLLFKPELITEQEPMGVIASAVKGLAGGLKQTEAAIGVAASPLVRSIAGDESADNILKYYNDTKKNWSLDPATTSKAGYFVGSLTNGLAPLVAGPAAPLTMGVRTMVDTGTGLIDQGVDTKTAVKAAAMAGSMMYAGAKAPVLGKTLKQTVALGAVNPLTGIAMKGAQAEYLEHQGYEEVASKIDPFDPTDIAVDTLFALAFGKMAWMAKQKHSAQIEKTENNTPILRGNVIDKDGTLQYNADGQIIPTTQAKDAANVLLNNKHMEAASIVDTSDAHGAALHDAMLTKAISDIESGKPADVTAIVESLPNDAEIKLKQGIKEIKTPEPEYYYAKEVELKDNIEEVQQIKLDAPSVLNPKDFITADEYVKAHGAPLYHRTNKVFDKFDLSKSKKTSQGIHFFDDKSVSDDPVFVSRFGDNQMEVYGNAKIADLTPSDLPDNLKKAGSLTGDALKKELTNQGYDGYKLASEVVIYNPGKIKTKAQLISEWNAARSDNPDIGKINELLVEHPDIDMVTGYDADGKPIYERADDVFKRNIEELDNTKKMESIYEKAAECLWEDF